jgi:hypothetical protein
MVLISRAVSRGTEPGGTEPGGKNTPSHRAQYQACRHTAIASGIPLSTWTHRDRRAAAQP